MCLIPKNLMTCIENSRNFGDFIRGLSPLFELRFLSVQEVMDHIGVKSEHDLRVQRNGVNLRILYMGKCRKANVIYDEDQKCLKLKIFDAPVLTSAGFRMGTATFSAPVDGFSSWVYMDWSVDIRKKLTPQEIKDQLVGMYNRVKRNHKIA